MARNIAKPIPKFDEVRYRNVDLIVSSNIIKKEFIQRCIDLKLDPYSVLWRGCKIKKRFAKEYWLGTIDPRVSKSFTQEDCLRALKYVGIEIKIMTILKPLEEASVQELTFEKK